jgi:excisionase family DNA binding protein
MSERKTLTIPEACEMLGISRCAGYEAAKRGEIPTVRVGKRVIVPRRQFETKFRIADDTPEPQAA